MPSIPRPFNAPDDIPGLIAYHEEVWDAGPLCGAWHLGDLAYFTWQTQSNISREFSAFNVWEDEGGRFKAFVLHNYYWNNYALHCRPDLRGSEEHMSFIGWSEQHLSENNDKETINAAGVDSADEAFIEALEACGYEHNRSGESGYVLLHRLHDLAEPTMPSGYQVIEIGENDAHIRAQVLREGWEGYGAWSDAKITGVQYHQFMQGPYYTPGLDFVAASNSGDYASGVTCGIDRPRQTGAVIDVATCTKWRRQGLARALVLTGLQKMKAADLSIVYISTGNEDAKKLYESVGFSPAVEKGVYSKVAR